jgi:hypothetical protein
MSKPSSNPLLFIGKPLKDEYGRQIGEIASFLVSPNGRIDGVLVRHGDGEFLRYSSDHFKLYNDGIILLLPIKLKVKSLCDEIPLIWRKDQALNELSGKKKVPSDMVEILHKNFEGALNQLKTDAKATLEEIDTQIEKCNMQIKDLNSALINLEIEHEIGRIDDKSYQKSMGIILEGSKQVNIEKSDLQAMRNNLSNMLLGEKSATTEKQVESQKETPSAPPPLPEPPVVVHVKSPSKTSS